MPAGRVKYNFYAVTNGKEIGVYTNWPQAGDAVLGFANAKYKGFGIYSDAADAMVTAGFAAFTVYDGQNTYSREDYEQSRLKQVGLSELLKATKTADKDIAEGGDLQVCDTGEIKEPTENQQLTPHDTVHTVYIDGSCIRNGTASAQAGIGLFWGDGHQWNSSIALTADNTPTNNKAELKAAIKVIQQAGENNLKELIINSDSKYVVNGVTEWVQKWMDNGWKTSSGEHVKNKEEWTELMNAIKSNNINIKWQHVPAHSGIAGNEEADRLALRAAKRETTEIQLIGQKVVTPSVESTSLNEKPLTTTTQPHIIVISGKVNDTGNSTKKLTVINVPTTPARKPTKDRSETPVPGSVNGSFVTGKEKAEKKDTKKKNEQQSCTVESMDSTQTVKIMKNFESVLQNVMFEIHQLKQQQIDFGVEIKDKLNNLYSRQHDLQNSISDVSNNLSSSIDRCYGKIKELGEVKKTEKTPDKTNDVMCDISSLQRKVDTSYDTVRSSIQSVENSVSTLKCGVDKMSKDCQVEFKAIESKNTQLQESVTEVNRDIKASKEVITEIEKSLTVMTQLEDFMRPSKTVKPTVPAEASTSTSTSNMYASLIDNDDEEVTFRNVESNEQSPIVITEETHEQPQLTEIEDGQPVDESSQNNKASTTQRDGEMAKESPNGEQNNSKIMATTTDTTEIERRTNDTRRDKVYLIGDSISGQINQPALGKSTRTFVQKLKAPKIQDISKIASQVKDAKLIIVHSGINNIRQNDSTENMVSDFVKAIQSLKEVAPDSKVVVSTPIPIGDQTLDIERNIFNASVAKALSENREVNVSFLDHGNLAEQAFPIKRYYRQDLVHLAPDGIDVYTTNLRRMIIQVLKKDVSPDEANQRKHINNDRNANNITSDVGYNRRNFSKDRYSGYTGNNGRIGHRNNFSGHSDGYQYREDNRGNNVNGSTGHHNTYNGNRDGYQHRDYNRGSNGKNSHRNPYSGNNNGYPYRDDYRGNNESIGHRNTFTRNRDDYRYRDDDRGHYESIGHRNTFTGNRDDYPYRDENRGHYESIDHRNTFTGNLDGYQHRDYDRINYSIRDDIDISKSKYDLNRYPSDNYYSGERYSERERRYDGNRRWV